MPRVAAGAFGGRVSRTSLRHPRSFEAAGPPIPETSLIFGAKNRDARSRSG